MSLFLKDEPVNTDPRDAQATSGSHFIREPPLVFRVEREKLGMLAVFLSDFQGGGCLLVR